MQGVGFRPWVYRHAVALGLAGFVVNGRDGVIIEVEGADAALDAFESELGADPPPLASITAIETVVLEPTGENGFAIGETDQGDGPAVAVPADVATCDACLAELRDPSDRRYRYPFINCTACGPRYTIIRGVPYDRAVTTMEGFPLCDECGREYRDPADRRFHAEPVACPACGPRLTYRRPDGQAIAEGEQALEAAIVALREGRIIAVKGVGGYHLATDATNAAAVAELRRRKVRDDKPFAVLVARIADVHGLVVLDGDAEAELASPRRPIVVAPVRSDTGIATGIAPGLAEIGVMLPYSPLHTLLAEGAGRALVMTSGNRSDEPIAHEDDDAVARLGPLVDALLTHDRPIHIRCDDSVIRASAGTVTAVRRSRGYAPQPYPLPVPGRPLLAVGAQLKNTIAVAQGGSVVASHHIGDLDHPAADASFRQAVSHLCGLTGVRPEVVAHDLHPGYRSTQYALELGLDLEGVQHHHAHIASCLVEHGVAHRVLGVAFDGLGLGDDGGLWGGELLVSDLVSSTRVGHLRPVALPGGDRAAREPWRMAVSWADAVLSDAAVADIASAMDERWESVRALARRADTPRTTSVGRLFDAVAALAGVRTVSSYEGHAAMELEAAAAGGRELCDAEGVELLSAATGLVLDPAPLLARVVALRSEGASAADIAATFHAGLARGVVRAVGELAGELDLDTVALSGGVFQNARLTSLVSEGLRRAGLRSLVHRTIPPNDGGISIGQAAVASARRAG